MSGPRMSAFPIESMRHLPTVLHHRRMGRATHDRRAEDAYGVDAMSAENHAQGYCRLHGVHRGVCGCRVASVDPGALGGREKPVQRFAPCDRPGCPICATRNALQTAHNESREGC